MDKKIKKIIFKWEIIFALTVLVIGTPTVFLRTVFAQAQDTCPDGGGWVKVNGLTGMNYSYTAPEGKLIAETCYKASTEVVYELIDPPQASVEVISTVGHDLSHASFRLVDEPTATATPTETFTPTPTATMTPTPTFTPTPTEEIELIPLSFSGECSASVVSLIVMQATEPTITWRVHNDNEMDISFTWMANNGESGAATVQANSESSFITNWDGNVVTLAYDLADEPMQVQASTEGCEPQQETEEPTPTETPTQEPTPTEEPTEEPTEVAVVAVDTQPDQPAGGSGPSLIYLIVPIMIGISGIAGVSTILLKNKNRSQS